MQLDYAKTYEPEVSIAMDNQRTHETKMFRKGEIKLQIEGDDGKYARVRGKYPHDDWFAECYITMLQEAGQ